MTVSRFAISFDPALARELRRAVGDESISAWVADAVRRKLRSEGLLRVIREWEAEHGALTDAELAAAARKRAGRKKRR